jgi:dynactin complex subunit
MSDSDSHLHKTVKTIEMKKRSYKMNIEMDKQRHDKIDELIQNYEFDLNYIKHTNKLLKEKLAKLTSINDEFEIEIKNNEKLNYQLNRAVDDCGHLHESCVFVDIYEKKEEEYVIAKDD